MVNWMMIGAAILPNVGGWAGALSMAGQVKRPDGKAWYQTLNKPTWTPPSWLFAPAWTTLYTGMGYASYKVYEECGGFNEESAVPLALFGAQLFLNWTWTPVFFGMHKIGLALINILALDATVVACTVSFFRKSTTAGVLMLPYIAWLSFATCLNYSIWSRNSGNDSVKQS